MQDYVRNALLLLAQPTVNKDIEQWDEFARRFLVPRRRGVVVRALAGIRQKVAGANEVLYCTVAVTVMAACCCAEVVSVRV
ncbi:MAG: hypothetical protein H5T63_03190, partial [Chloroflexi bacterium]|nr:hypothetical protein [Chloroflexota bacterium]